MIEKGIPAPKANKRREKPYPFDEMEIGDSMMIDRPQEEVSARATYWKRKTGFQFVTKKQKGGTRVWRLA